MPTPQLPSHLPSHPSAHPSPPVRPTFEEVVPAELEAELAEEFIRADGDGPLPVVEGVRLGLGVAAERLYGGEQGGLRLSGQPDQNGQRAGRLRLHRLTRRLDDVRHHHGRVLLARTAGAGGGGAVTDVPDWSPGTGGGGGYCYRRPRLVT